jgi:hypothetical protein
MTAGAKMLNVDLLALLKRMFPWGLIDMLLSQGAICLCHDPSKPISCWMDRIWSFSRFRGPGKIGRMTVGTGYLERQTFRDKKIN